MKETRNAHKIFIIKPEEKGTPGRLGINDSTIL
jgi:hypothetical protein